MNFYENKNIGVVGFGKTGQATVCALENFGANIFLFDDRKDLTDVILSGKLPLRKYTLEELIQENKSFKEINNLYNSDSIER